MKEYTGLSLYFTRPFNAVPTIIIIQDQILRNNKEGSIVDRFVLGIRTEDDDNDNDNDNDDTPNVELK